MWAPPAGTLLAPATAVAQRASCRGFSGRPTSPEVASPGSCCFVGELRPVLKHGPRSLTWVRVVGWQTLVRREIEIALALYRVHGWQRVVLLFSA